jgi:glycoside/pentoside/hexuronide:cation symporter, GPH family
MYRPSGALAGFIVHMTRSVLRICDAFIPVITSALAIWAVWAYPITEETAGETRAELERRRGTSEAPASAPA